MKRRLLHDGHGRDLNGNDIGISIPVSPTNKVQDLIQTWSKRLSLSRPRFERLRPGSASAVLSASKRDDEEVGVKGKRKQPSTLAKPLVSDNGKEVGVQTSSFLLDLEENRTEFSQPTPETTLDESNIPAPPATAIYEQDKDADVATEKSTTSVEGTDSENRDASAGQGQAEPTDVSPDAEGACGVTDQCNIPSNNQVFSVSSWENYNAFDCSCMSEHSEYRSGCSNTCCGCNMSPCYAQPHAQNICYGGFGSFSSHCGCGVQHLMNLAAWQTPDHFEYNDATNLCALETCLQNNPDIMITSEGNFLIGSTFLLDAQNSCRRYFVNGFDIEFHGKGSHAQNFRNNGVRLDFCTAGFVNPESLVAEVDDKGNLLVQGDIFGSLSRLWMFVEDFQGPDKVNIEHPSMFYFTIEIPVREY